MTDDALAQQLDGEAVKSFAHSPTVPLPQLVEMAGAWGAVGACTCEHDYETASMPIAKIRGLYKSISPSLHPSRSHRGSSDVGSH